MAETNGNLDEALRYALEASKNKPDSVAMSDTVGWIYFKKQASESAIQVLTNVVQKEPKDPIYRYHLAAAMLQNGDAADAKKELQTAMANRPNKVYEEKIKDLMAKIN
jgi:predicted Zn-dependent protease